jgi:hypothetical protein
MEITLPGVALFDNLLFNPMKRHITRYFLRGGIIILLLLGLGRHSTWFAAAQEAGSWSYPLPISPQGEFGFQPILVSDSTGVLHAFWSSDLSEDPYLPRAIYYARYVGGEWTQPLDILISPNGLDVYALRSVIDRAGRIHLFWSTPAERSPFGPIYHSSAPVAEAGVMHSWQTPVIVAYDTYQSDVALDPEGRLHLVYGGIGAGGICHIFSEDNGDSWTEESCKLTVAYRDQEHDTRPRLAIDSQGTLHVVWMLDDYSPASSLAYFGRGIYYARSIDNGRSWSDILVIDEVDGRGDLTRRLQPEWPGIVVDLEDRVHIVWVSSRDMARYHQWSGNGGVTWSVPQVAIRVPYYNGWMGLAVDGANVLHFLTAGLGGVTYSRWPVNGAWAPPVHFDGDDGAHYVDLAVVLGNEVHAVWQNHGLNVVADTTLVYEGRIAHAFMLTDGQRQLAQPIPTVQQPAQLAIAVEPVATPASGVAVTTAPPARPPVQQQVEDSLTESTTPTQMIFVSLLPVLFLIGFVFIFRRRS